MRKEVHRIIESLLPSDDAYQSKSVEKSALLLLLERDSMIAPPIDGDSFIGHLLRGVQQVYGTEDNWLLHCRHYTRYETRRAGFLRYSSVIYTFSIVALSIRSPTLTHQIARLREYQGPPSTATLPR